MLPPTTELNRLELELRLGPHRDREDAVQEAWLAHLEGRDPATAANTYLRRQRRYRQREAATDPLGALPVAANSAAHRRLVAPLKKMGPVSRRAGGKRVLRRGPAPMPKCSALAGAGSMEN
jgi:hypothetical protein